MTTDACVSVELLAGAAHNIPRLPVPQFCCVLGSSPVHSTPRRQRLARRLLAEDDMTRLSNSEKRE